MPSTETRVLASLVRHMKESEKDPLTPLIDTYLSQRKGSGNRLQEWTISIPERARPGGRLSPSAIAGCQRMAVLKFVGFDTERKYIDPDRELIFEDGNWRHHKWDALFYDMECVLGKDVFRCLEYERSVAIPRLYVAGSLDFTIKIGGKRYVVDFKGANSFAFHRIHLANKPPEEYTKQLFTYMVARGIRRGILLFDNKDNQQYKVFVYELDENAWGEVERWCQRVIMHLQRESLPGRHQNCNNGSFLYERCPFSSFCYGKHKDDKERLRRMAFKNFVGIDEAWAQGLREAS